MADSVRHHEGRDGQRGGQRRGSHASEVSPSTASFSHGVSSDKKRGPQSRGRSRGYGGQGRGGGATRPRSQGKNEIVPEGLCSACWKAGSKDVKRHAGGFARCPNAICGKCQGRGHTTQRCTRELVEFLADKDLTQLGEGGLLEEGLFKKLRSLRQRDCSLLTPEQERIFVLESEKRIALEAKRLQGKKINFSKLTVKKLNCCHYKLGVLPDDIRKFKQLTVLDCGYNDLTELPAAIGELAVLQQLYCNNNVLTALPKEIGNLKHLTKLDCRYNQLKALPQEIGNLTQLLNLDCRGNILAELPRELGQLRELRRFDCFENRLETLPLELRNLISLEDHRFCRFTGNPLLCPPLAVAEQGARAVVAFLAEVDPATSTADTADSTNATGPTTDTTDTTDKTE